MVGKSLVRLALALALAETVALELGQGVVRNGSLFVGDVGLIGGASELGQVQDLESLEPEQASWFHRVVQVPLLEAHDAAMAYLSPSKARRHDCHHFKTQSFRANATFHSRGGEWPSGFSSLLDCGVRALDLRLGRCPSMKKLATFRKGLVDGKIRARQYLAAERKETKARSDVNGTICMHHGTSWILHTTFEAELASVMRWSKENPGNLIILKIVPDGGGEDVSLRRDIYRALHSHNIHSIDGYGSDSHGSSCWGTKGHRGAWPLWYAKPHKVLAVWKYDIGDTGQPNRTSSCVEDNFVPSIGFNPFSVKHSFQSLQSYAVNIIHNQFRPPREPSSSNAVFQEVQLLWQTAGTEMFYDLSATYSILDVNAMSGLNAFLKNYTSDRLFESANLVKMNNICMFGMDVARRLGTKVSKQQEQRCEKICGGLNAFNSCK